MQKRLKTGTQQNKLTKAKANTIRISTKTISSFKIQSNTDKFVTDFGNSKM